MNITMILVGAASALLTDLQAFAANRAKNPEARFDFVLCITRTLAGALTGLVGSQFPGVQS